MTLSQSVNARLSRWAAAAQGAGAEGWQARLPLVISALLVVLLAWQLVQLTWTLLGAGNGNNIVAVVGPGGDGASTTGPAAPSTHRVDIGTIVNAHLFGTATAPANADPNQVAASQMPLVLVGTIANTNPQLGYAIIGDSAASARVYAVGKTVTGGAKLHSVYPDRAILARGGRLEALLLPKQYRGGGMNGNLPMASAGGSADPLLGERLRQLAQSNPGAITDILRPQPVFANGQQKGYRVYPGRNRALFNKLGLLPGDMVTSINGTPLDDPARGMEILQTMNSAANVNMTVERNGESIQVNINNAQIAQDAAALQAPAEEPETVPVEEQPAMNSDDEETESTE
jgi:general secretion pathway protein C